MALTPAMASLAAPMKGSGCPDGCTCRPYESSREDPQAILCGVMTGMYNHTKNGLLLDMFQEIRRFGKQILQQGVCPLPRDRLIANHGVGRQLLVETLSMCSPLIAVSHECEMPERTNTGMVVSSLRRKPDPRVVDSQFIDHRQCGPRSQLISTESR